MNKLKVAYFGSPDFAAAYLEQLVEDESLPIEIVAVFTQPDQPAGRKQELTPTPVKLTAQKLNIEVVDVVNISNFKFQISNCDLALVYAYGKILPDEILKLPKYGFLNVHPSLLPKYRGVAPMAYSLLLGDVQTGVSLIMLDEEMDHGPIVSQETYEIKPGETRTDLEKNLTNLAVKMTRSVFENLKLKIENSRTQEHEHATFTRFLTKNDGFVPFKVLKKLVMGEELSHKDLPDIIRDYYDRNSNESFENLKLKIENLRAVYYDLYRALSPWPGIWTFVDIDGQQKRLKIAMVKWLNGHIVITKVQLEGKTEVEFKTFNETYSLF